MHPSASSPMLRVCPSEKKGRCFFATVSIPAGTVVLVASSYAAIPDSASLSERCAACLKSVQQQSKLSCTSCSQLIYCSEGCRGIDHDQFHQRECAILSVLRSRARELAGSDADPDYICDLAHLILRVLIRRYSESTASQSFSDPLQFSEVDKLVSNETRFLHDRHELFGHLSSLLLELLTQQGMLPLPSHQEVVALICKEECNSFGLYDFRISAFQERQGYGLALYPSAVFFNHSCTPNIGHVARGKQMIFYTVKAICPDEELCISYIDLGRQTLADTRRRRAKLRDIFFFDCDCSACCISDTNLEDQPSSTALSSSALNEHHCATTNCYGILAPESLMSKELQSGEPVLEGYIRWRCEACKHSVDKRS